VALACHSAASKARYARSPKRQSAGRILAHFCGAFTKNRIVYFKCWLYIDHLLYFRIESIHVKLTSMDFKGNSQCRHEVSLQRISYLSLYQGRRSSHSVHDEFKKNCSIFCPIFGHIVPLGSFLNRLIPISKVKTWQIPHNFVTKLYFCAPLAPPYISTDFKVRKKKNSFR